MIRDCAHRYEQMFTLFFYTACRVTACCTDPMLSIFELDLPVLQESKTLIIFAYHTGLRAPLRYGQSF
jgi:hypothetical protein